MARYCQHPGCGDRSGRFRLCEHHRRLAATLAKFEPPRPRRLVGAHALEVADRAAADPRETLTETEAAALLGLRKNSLRDRRLAAPTKPGVAPPFERDAAGRVTYARAALVAWLREHQAVHGGKPKRRLTWAEVAEIRASTEGPTALARRLGVCPTVVAHARAGRGGPGEAAARATRESGYSPLLSA